MTSHLPNHDHDYDGRPPVGDDDPLLAALIAAHPDMAKQYGLEPRRGRVPIL